MFLLISQGQNKMYWSRAQGTEPVPKTKSPKEGAPNGSETYMTLWGSTCIHVHVHVVESSLILEKRTKIPKKNKMDFQ